METLQKLTKELERRHKAICDSLLSKTCYENVNLLEAAGVNHNGGKCSFYTTCSVVI
jgi:hypothetical protein